MIEHLWRIEVMLAILCGAVGAMAIMHAIRFALSFAPKTKIVNVINASIPKSMGPVPRDVDRALRTLADASADHG
jgi:hypothetical protein